MEDWLTSRTWTISRREPPIIRIEVNDLRTIRIGEGIEVTEHDVDEVMSFARVSRSSAILALRENEGNVAEALYDLEQTEPDEEQFVPPRNPLEPTDDMLTTWALERLFSKGTLLDKDDVERVEDVRYRTSEAFRYGYWMNPEYRDILKKRRADSL
jgi:Holliday junction resolvase